MTPPTRPSGTAAPGGSLLTGDLIPAGRLIPSGLVCQVLPAAEFVADVEAAARRLTGTRQPAQQRVKVLPHATCNLDDDAALAAELNEFAAAWATPT